AFPLPFISNSSDSGMCGHPTSVVLLTADAFGVLPPIAKLTHEQAMYHFISGYTAKLAGTEVGVKEPSATFSTCFGAPFMPRDTWADASAFDAEARKLARMFVENFARFEDGVGASLVAAGPKAE